MVMYIYYWKTHVIQGNVRIITENDITFCIVMHGNNEWFYCKMHKDIGNHNKLLLQRIVETKGCMNSTSFTYNVILVYLPVTRYSETVSMTGAVRGNCAFSSVNDNYSCVERQLLLCQMTITPRCSGCWIWLLQLKFTGQFRT